MAKHFLILTLALYFISFSTQAQLVYDTINEAIIGPGTKLIEVNENTQPWAIQVLEIDLTNPYLKIETAKANDRLYGLEKTSSMALRKSAEGHKVIGAINGDFFYGGGKPVNAQIAGGELVRTPISRSTVGFSTTNEPIIQIPYFSGKVFANAIENQLNNVNDVRSVNNLILYNQFIGESTQTNPYGNELICTPISNWVVNDTVWLVASELLIGSGNTTIPEGSVVLSGHGTSATFLEENIANGDTIGVLINLGDDTKVLQSLIGGYPQIIKDGENYVDTGYDIEGGPDHTYDRHPRTSVGYSKDTTKLYLVTVDGRQDHSVGMTLHELADFMLQINCHHGVNLDGGGSTTMVANHEIANSPSDYNGERSVANAIIVVSSAPEGSLNNIKIQPSEINMRYGYNQKIEVSGYDEYNNIIEIDTNNLSYSITNNLGNIQNRILYAYNETGSGYLKVNYGELADSVLVTIHPIVDLSLSPEEIATDSIIPVEFKAITTNIDTREFIVPAPLATWDVENSEIGTVTEHGVFQGLTSGTTTVSATVGEVTAEAEVTVEIYRETLLLDAMETAESWYVMSSSLDSISVHNTAVHTQGSGGIEIYYEFAYANRTPYVELKKVIPIPGIPDSIWLDTKYDGKNHRITMNFWNGESTFNPSYGALLNHNLFAAEGFELETIELEDYPYSVEEIKIEIWKNTDWSIGQLITGRIYLDNLRASYPGHSLIPTPVGIIRTLNINELQVYPNPAKDELQISINDLKTKKAQLKLFDLKGRLLIHKQVSVNNSIIKYQLPELQDGLYFLRINTNSEHYFSKIIIKNN